ncbi:GNAT family N-acetyltransferase [Phascolarctobacterium sp.]|uniref:GNAT family N-acetyltransferase n=1 Tax=Phascolarctobacterium sp. TaxID=2049039 RepID=UPI0038642744
MLSVARYMPQDRNLWNQFNREAKNPLFMFDRNFMDYHSDRFQDHSLLFFDEGELIALLPLSEKGRVLTSHGGLTYGGFITGTKMKQHTMNDCFEALISYAKENGFEKIVYKVIPHIYHEQPAEEDRYALFINHASVVKIEASTVVNLKQPLKMPKGRKAQVSRAKREGVVVQELTADEDFERFIQLENAVLAEHHDTRAVHTGAELALLHSRFPEQIHLFGALKEEELIAGTVIFEYRQVVHTQYMAANAIARQIGALDLTISTVLEKYKNTKLWLDFGISTENGGMHLNEGLISQKEGFGGRTNVCETFLLEFALISKI